MIEADTKAMLENSTVVMRMHPVSVCRGEVCAVHNRTDHSMRSWRQFFRYDRGIMERICPHGIGHPDPDDMMILIGHDDGVHACDGCCTENEGEN